MCENRLRGSVSSGGGKNGVGAAPLGKFCLSLMTRVGTKRDSLYGGD